MTSIDYDKFISLGSHGRGGRSKFSLVSISSGLLTFNATAKNVINDKKFKYVTYKYYQNQLLLDFQKSKSDGYYRLYKHCSSLQSSFRSASTKLKEYIDSDLYNYQYKLLLEPDGHHVVIDLEQPYIKKAIKRGR
ncbi:hypothetical protein LA430_14030 [Lactiplantibacillus plantarum]|uniref:hypothetical protein n=1 Tax=Lactiplantibacillus plantarum TaxID=1590 RepID=UPI001E43CBB3|nr:hypothetical protein [Lactiplantibacillus plantarum]MCC6117621.1 hypothetical protein [Lactiplantibacillus plantarum]MCW6115168.1 hypothetical protein [Lactiplantibacillus plantarum]